MNHQLPFRFGEQTIGNVVIGDNSSAYVGSFSSYNVQEQRNAQQALSFPEMYDRQHQIQAESPDTCSWILDDPVFVLWQKSPRGLLWIKGRPGAGKSTIMRYIWRYLTRGRKSQSSVVACFFCHGRGKEVLQRSPKGVYRALLHQIIQQVQQLNAEFAKDFEARCKARGQHGSAWDWEDIELRTFLAEYLNRASRDVEVLILVDALDECGESAAKELLRFFQKSDTTASGTRQQGYLKVCVSSRHYPLVATGVPCEISVDDKNSADIHKFVAHELSQVICQGAEYDQLLSAIASGAGNIFQWAVVVIARVIRSLEDDKSIEMVLEDIVETPQELFPLYQQILRIRLDTTNITSKDKKRFHDLFQWVALARRPLSLEELDFALSVQSSSSEVWRKGTLSRRYVERVSCGLISVATDRHKVDPPVQFIHHSVQEYFVNGQGIQDLGDASSPIDTRTMQLDIVRICHQSILPSRSLAPRTRTPLHEYASDYMFAHARSAEEGQAVQHDLARILNWPQEDFVQRLAAFSRKHYISMEGLEELAGQGSCLLHFAAAFDIPNLVSSILMLAPDMDINTCDSNGWTALHHAAQLSSYGALDRLLAMNHPSGTICMNQILNLNARTYNGYTPLIIAAGWGCSDVVLERLAQTPGVDLNAMEYVKHSTALHYAIMSWRMTAAEILIHHGADIRLRNDELQTPLSIAASQATNTATFFPTDDERKEAFALFCCLLTEAKEDLYLRDDQGNTPLQRVLGSSRSRAFAEVLLEEGLDPSTPDQHGRIWLSYLGQYTDSDTVDLLLAQPGVDVNIRDSDERTPLACWVNRPHLDESALRRFLEDPRVDACDPDNKGYTPLTIAAMYGCFTGVRLLLHYPGLDARAFKKHIDTALYYVGRKLTVVESQLRRIKDLADDRRTIFIEAYVDEAKQTIELLKREANRLSLATIDK
jgi:ankyrin repeat protein